MNVHIHVELPSMRYSTFVEHVQRHIPTLTQTFVAAHLHAYIGIPHSHTLTHSLTHMHIQIQGTTGITQRHQPLQTCRYRMRLMTLSPLVSTTASFGRFSRPSSAYLSCKCILLYIPMLENTLAACWCKSMLEYVFAFWLTLMFADWIVCIEQMSLGRAPMK